MLQRLSFKVHHHVDCSEGFKSLNSIALSAFFSVQENTVRALNYLTAIFFAFDAIMKMVAKGVLLTPKAYFQVRKTALHII